MNGKSKYAFYGSLRQGMYNHSSRSGEMEVEKTVELTGFQMFSLGAYPYIVETGEKEDKITVELVTIHDPDTERSIHRMELGAGYDYKEVAVDGEEYGIYVYPNRYSGPLVEGGDWVKFVNNGRE